MLGLGTSVTNIDSGQIYKELSELSNYADLDIHFDFSNLSGDMEDGATFSAAINNLGAGGADNNIDAVVGEPTLDTRSLSRACVDFPNSGDSDHIFSMANAYETTGKAMTFFIVMQLDVDTTQILVASAPDGDSDYIQFFSNGRIRIRLAGGTATSVVTSNTNNSTISYAPVVNTPMVMVWQRLSDGISYFWNDNGLFTAALSDTGDATWTLGAIGGTTSGSNTDFDGKVCEVGLYDADINEANVSILLESLCTKWGINRRE